MESFGSLAPYLKDPLVLVGFLLLLFFGILRTLIKSGIIPQTWKQGDEEVKPVKLPG